MIIEVKPKSPFRVPVEAECITPEKIKGYIQGEKMEVWEGNRKRNIENLFDIKLKENDDSKVELLLKGDFTKVKRIGAGMTSGSIIIQGNAGMHLGEGMKGGSIKVLGNVDSWVGGMMEGGSIEVMGNAKDYVGATYRGSRNGMKGGLIIIHGNAGNEVGCYMRGGLVCIHGNAGQFLGIHMMGGTLLVYGDCDDRVGAEMTDGKIIICGRVRSILPTFTIEDIKSKVKVDGEKITGPFYLFRGDLAEEGNGRLYVSKVKNPHLSFYEELL
ncbi:formylmethanofuran dehydrogenase subunit C [Candidatus Bathyarchaeota archaeon]|nr:MAG: formylmethanofuran dehydrogenase subunit C [Candidatus Bathyarchaeota archaeon]